MTTEDKTIEELEQFEDKYFHKRLDGTAKYWATEIGSDGDLNYPNPEAVRQDVRALLSSLEQRKDQELLTLLDELEMEDDFGHSWACDDDGCVCENRRTHELISNHNTKISHIKESLKTE